MANGRYFLHEKEGTAIITYRFEWKGKQVQERQPGHCFWMLQYHTNNLPRYLLHRALYNVLGWICQRLNGFYRDPEMRGWNTEIKIGNRWRDPCYWISSLFWYKEKEVSADEEQRRIRGFFF